MLYDPKWEQKIKPEVFSLTGLIAWLETQPAEGTYNWRNIYGCLACNYLRAMGHPSPAEMLGGNEFEQTCGGLEGYYRIALGRDDSGKTGAWTYGAALERARKFAALTETAS